MVTQPISCCVAPRFPAIWGKRDVDDGGVEHLHDGRRDEAEQDEPAVPGHIGRSCFGRCEGSGWSLCFASGGYCSQLANDLRLR